MYQMLLVDDEYMILEGLKKLIPWHDLQIEIIGTAKNGQEALEFVRQNEVDIVISDVTMPLLSGIEFIRLAQEEAIYFHFLILSGYQEFEYVKEGLRMGADNYLIKPVDKVELIETLEKTIASIKKEKEQQETQNVLVDYLLQGWIHDEIDYSELKKRMHSFGYELSDKDYTVILFHFPLGKEETLTAFFSLYQQVLYYPSSDTNEYTLVFSGSKSELQQFVEAFKDMNQKNQHEFLIAIGETVGGITEVASSYNHATHSSQIRDFYQVKGLEPSDILETTSGILPQSSFVAFNQALSIRDVETIHFEIDKMLTLMRQQGTLPDYSRHMIFLIFMDLYRQFETLDESFYQKSFEQIANAHSFESLEKVIEDTLIEIKNVKKERAYSGNIQHMLAIIMERYSEDLSLKVVADELYLNVMYLGQIFKKETKKSFSQYLNHYRIKQAQDLLVHSDNNINEIAVSVGYTSAGYFYKNFKKICGISPKEFRERFVSDYNPIDS